MARRLSSKWTGAVEGVARKAVIEESQIKRYVVSVSSGTGKGASR